MSSVSVSMATFLYRRRNFLLVFCGALTILSLQVVSGLKVSNSLEVWYPDDAVAIQEYRDFKAEFGNDEVVLLTITAVDGFTEAAATAVLESVADDLYEIDGVAKITSLATVPTSMRNARARLLSHDGQTTVVVIEMMTGTEFEAQRPRVLEQINDVIRDRGLDAHLAGYGVIYEALNKASTEGSVQLLLFAHLLMFCVLLFFFRRLLPVVATLLAIGMATSWMMAAYVALGKPLNMVTMALPTLVLVMGIANCTHLLRSVARQNMVQSHETRVIMGLARPLWPCVISSLTTAVGFLSLMSSPLPVVADLGLFGALGILMAFVSSLFLVSYFLRWPRVIPHLGGRGLDHLGSRLSRIAMQSPKTTLIVFLAVSVMSVLACFQLQADTNSIGYLPANHPVRLDSDFIEDQIGNYSPVDYTLHSDRNLLDLELLDAIQDWQINAERIDTVDWSWSTLDLLGLDRDVKPSRLGQQEIFARLQKLEKYSPSSLLSMVGTDGTQRLTFGGPMQSASSARQLINKIQAAAELPADVVILPAGYIPLYTRIIDEIVSSQVRGFAIAIPMIILLLGLALRSWGATLAAIPANLIPVLSTLGLMGFLGIPLDIATVTIGTVVLGLVVDDSVHLLYEARRGTHSFPQLATGMEAAVARSGGTLLLTSISLVAGFLVFGFAEIRSVQLFGLLAAFAMTVAILTDLLLLPALSALQTTGLAVQMAKSQAKT